MAAMDLNHQNSPEFLSQVAQREACAALYIVWVSGRCPATPFSTYD
jgi:hypothetical protein